jgi:ABC-type multidrug transport system, ATPase component
MHHIVEIKDLSKNIEGTTILNNISMQITKGEIYALLGSNGAGKTTLMKSIYHIMIPTAGTVSVLGENITEKNNNPFYKMGSIIETPVFYEEFNARKNLEFHCAYMRTGHGRIEEMLSLLGLINNDKLVKHFSLGMKQRLAIARALITKPELLILDEPMNGLDPQGIIEIRELLLKINHERNTTILISSHILNEVSKIADTIGVIENGSIIAEFSMDKITKKGIDLEEYYMNLLREKGA